VKIGLSDNISAPFASSAEIRPFQENKSPKNGPFSEEKASGLGGFNFWNYLRT
jgi:hypothetical protein